MHNVIMRKIDVTGEYQPLSAVMTVASVTISCPPGNAGVVLFACGDGQDVPWVAGEWHELQRINLSQLQVKGTPGDVVTVVGGTW